MCGCDKLTRRQAGEFFIENVLRGNKKQGQEIPKEVKKAVADLSAAQSPLKRRKEMDSL